MTQSQPTRIEKDSMGEMNVPADALYGASTQRAVLNFPVSGQGFTRPYIRALGLVKLACAEVNRELGLLPPATAEPILAACQEVIDGRLDSHFVVDIYQTGSGTSTNMNANEVIANRAGEIAGAGRASKAFHPNDHVNMGQSSNDVIPTAMHVAIAEQLASVLIPALDRLAAALTEKERAWDNIVKIGRTHLMDATPIRLGQVFGGFAQQAILSSARARKAILALRELPQGGTAVGTGINTHIEFGKRVAARLARLTGIDFIEAHNHFEAQAAKDGVIEASGLLKTIALALAKIANDVRWLGSGPRCGIGEILLPATQPGSSIMPGKVNPVMSESLLQACSFTIGADACATHAVTWGSVFELNVAMPVVAHQLLEAIRILAAATQNFAEKCIAGAEANVQRCEGLIEQSLAMCTSLAPIVGYDAAAAMAKQSYLTGKTVREIALASGKLPPEKVAEAMDVRAMTMPGASGAASG